MPYFASPHLGSLVCICLLEDLLHLDLAQVDVELLEQGGELREEEEAVLALVGGGELVPQVQLVLLLVLHLGGFTGRAFSSVSYLFHRFNQLVESVKPSISNLEAQREL